MAVPLLTVVGVLLQTVGGVVLEGTLATPGARPAYAIVYLVPDGTPAPMAADTGVINQQGLRFVPGLVAIRPGAAIEFRNSDPVLHNVFGPPGLGPGFNLGTYSQAERRWQVFDTPGVYPILCHIHPEMVAYVVVSAGAHMTQVDVRGQFRFENVPPGRYVLHAWHPRGRQMERAIVVRPREAQVIALVLPPDRAT